MHDAAGELGFHQRPVHRRRGAFIDQRSDQGRGLARVADRDRGVGGPQAGQQPFVDVLMDDEPPQGGATLAGGAHGREGDAAQGEVQIRRGRDDGGVVAAQLE